MFANMFVWPQEHMEFVLVRYTEYIWNFCLFTGKLHRSPFKQHLVLNSICYY